MAKQQLNSAQTKNVISSSEVDTGKTWLDGRPIYRKTFEGTINIINGDSSIPHLISGLTSSFMVLSTTGGIAIAGNATKTSKQTFQYREAGGNWCSLVEITGTNITFRSSWAWGSSYVVVIMEYIK